MRILGLTRENLYDEFIDNIEGIQIDIDNMIVFDYIVNNRDRHLKNSGFLLNEDKILFAQIYDNGLSLGSHLNDEEIESEEIEDLLMDADYANCFDTSNKKQLDLVKKCTLNLDFDYESIVRKYSKYLSEKRIEFIIELLKERTLEVKRCLFQNQK